MREESKGWLLNKQHLSSLNYSGKFEILKLNWREKIMTLPSKIAESIRNRLFLINLGRSLWKTTSFEVKLSK